VDVGSECSSSLGRRAREKKKACMCGSLTRGEGVDSAPQIDWGSTTNETRQGKM